MAKLCCSAFLVLATLLIGARSQNVVQSKWELWSSSKTLLRGANIYGARVIEELDGGITGPGPIGPPYSQDDFNALAALGANYIVISHPGLFTEDPPYELSPEFQDNLDSLLEMIGNANMYATIALRTGPGRSNFGFWCSYQEPGEECYQYLNDKVWEEQAAQDAWVEMWRHMASRYKDNPIVAGYDLMVEPNSSDLFFGIFDPEVFYQQYSGTTYDWNQMYPGIVSAIREVDTNTPIIISGNSYGSIDWLPYVDVLNNEEKIVYSVHTYHPFQYTHQETPPFVNTYPGNFDIDYDGQSDVFDSSWLDQELLSPLDSFGSENDMPICVQEFGVIRWVPGAAEYMRDLMELFEERGLNHALWSWDPDYTNYNQYINEFNFRFGPDPSSVGDVANSLQDSIVQNWALNTVRPYDENRCTSWLAFVLGHFDPKYQC